MSIDGQRHNIKWVFAVLAPADMNEAGSSTSATPPYQSCVLVAVFSFAEICLSSVVFLFL